MTEPEGTPGLPEPARTTDAEDEKAEGPGAPTADRAPAPREQTRGWGFPRFAKDFPPDPELDRLVAAFERGDYRAVADGAPKLAAKTDREDVKRAAELLAARTKPDASAKLLFVVAALLLAGLTAFWVTHDGPPPTQTPAAH